MPSPHGANLAPPGGWMSDARARPRPAVMPALLPILEATRQITRERRLGEAAAAREAAEIVGREMRDLDVLHTPDPGAGGGGRISGLGDRSVNRSIGGQWGNGRAAQLKRRAEQAREQGVGQMDVELEICGEERNGAPPNGQPSGPRPGGGQPGTGQPPMS